MHFARTTGLLTISGAIALLYVYLLMSILPAIGLVNAGPDVEVGAG